MIFTTHPYLVSLLLDCPPGQPSWPRPLPLSLPDLASMQAWDLPAPQLRSKPPSVVGYRLASSPCRCASTSFSIRHVLLLRLARTQAFPHNSETATLSSAFFQEALQASLPCCLQSSCFQPWTIAAWAPPCQEPVDPCPNRHDGRPCCATRGMLSLLKANGELSLETVHDFACLFPCFLACSRCLVNACRHHWLFQRRQHSQLAPARASCFPLAGRGHQQRHHHHGPPLWLWGHKRCRLRCAGL